MKISYLYKSKESNMSIITFLGTGTSQGVPIIGCKCRVCTSSDPKDKRLRSSVLIEQDGKRILIDAGPDFRQQLLRENIDNLDAILLTHEHKDHTGGLDDVRAINYLKGKALPIYCEERVRESLEREYAYAFCEEKYPGVPEFDIRTIGNSPFNAQGVKVQPIRILHYKLPILGFRIGDISYITDASYISTEELEKTKYNQKRASYFPFLTRTSYYYCPLCLPGDMLLDTSVTPDWHPQRTGNLSPSRHSCFL